MASIYDLFQTSPTKISFKDPLSGDTKEFTIDASISLDTSIQAKVSNYPVEGRENISDHIQPEPLSLVITGFISESPSQQLLTIASALAGAGLNRLGQFRGLSATAASAAASAAVFGGASLLKSSKEASVAALLTSRSEVDPDYPKKAFHGLIKMLEQGLPFNVRTFFTDTLYRNMAMTNLTYKQTAKDGESLSFVLTCRKIVTVELFSQITSEFRMKDPAGASGAEAGNKGKKTTEDAGKKVEDSALFSLGRRATGS